MLICILTGENKISKLAQNYICKTYNLKPLNIHSSELIAPHNIIKSVIILDKLIEWESLKKFNCMLLLIFCKESDFFDDVCKIERISSKVHFLNGHDQVKLKKVLDTIKLNIRPDWQKYFMDIAMVVYSRSTCLKRNVEAVLVKDKRIISTGYNGTAKGTINCIDGWCSRCNANIPSGTNLDLCICLHAEESAIMGILSERLRGFDLYVTLFPCILCAKKIIQSGISKIIFKDYYCAKDKESKGLLESLGIIVKKYEELWRVNGCVVLNTRWYLLSIYWNFKE